MDRVVEPELMDDDEQARAYAGIDFGEAHQNVITFFHQTFPGEDVTGYVLDLGCGPGDITRRFALAFPNCILHGLDGSESMLRYGRELFAQDAALRDRVALIQGMLPGATLPRVHYDVVISNSLLHHLHDPQVLWQAVRQYAAPGARVFIMDLRRPATADAAWALVEKHATSDPEVFKRDFYNSLLAAFTPAEIEAQLQTAGLDHFTVRPVTDRHVIVAGRMG
ncbi:MAG TPA: class I SAM-dependent methyltransferase [Herpetosiphonaceae bacterium]